MRRKSVCSLLATLALLLGSLAAHAGMVRQFAMTDLVGNADKVFRGTVLSAERGSVDAGGGELPTITYVVRVDESISGRFESGKGGLEVSLTMLASPKAEVTSGDYQRAAIADINPHLEVGKEYVLFTTQPSRIGLSTTVGLDQGLFRIYTGPNGEEMAANALENAGLFNGPVSYADLKAAVTATRQ